jgi:N-dimethylarginine dimethylaminohydrolase
MKRLLMCPPDYYGIEYEINPWMNVERGADVTLARRQWGQLYDLLTAQMEIDAELIEPVKGLPDMAFTANAGLVFEGKFIRSNFRYRERSGEAAYFEKWFAERGYEVVRLPENLFFEGEGDAFILGESLFAGYRFRSEIRSHTLIGEILQKEALSLELVDPRFYHLDTCFCPLRQDLIAYYPDAFDTYANRVIEENIPNRIVVTPEDALRFGANAIVVGQSVVINSGCADLHQQLAGAGFTVHETDLSEFIKAGGSAKCLVLFI